MVGHARTATHTPGHHGPPTSNSASPPPPPQEELRLFDGALAALPALVVANKIDALADPWAALGRLKAATGLPIVPVSAARGLGIARLRRALRMVAAAR